MTAARTVETCSQLPTICNKEELYVVSDVYLLLILRMQQQCVTKTRQHCAYTKASQLKQSNTPDTKTFACQV